MHHKERKMMTQKQFFTHTHTHTHTRTHAHTLARARALSLSLTHTLEFKIQPQKCKLPLLFTQLPELPLCPLFCLHRRFVIRMLYHRCFSSYLASFTQSFVSLQRCARVAQFYFGQAVFRDFMLCHPNACTLLTSSSCLYC